MSEPTITCPSCKTEMKLTESLAASLLESARRDYESRLAKKAQKATLTFQKDLDHKNQEFKRDWLPRAIGPRKTQKKG